MNRRSGRLLALIYVQLHRHACAGATSVFFNSRIVASTASCLLLLNSSNSQMLWAWQARNNGAMHDACMHSNGANRNVKDRLLRWACHLQQVVVCSVDLPPHEQQAVDDSAPAALTYVDQSNSQPV